MTRRALLLTTIATLLAGASVAHADHPYDNPGYGDTALLASVRADGHGPAWIEVHDGQRYDQLTFVARGGAVRFDDVVVRFENGRAIRLDVPRRLRAGEAVTVDLPGNGRRIESIQIDYANRRWGRRRAVLDIFGVERDDGRFDRRYQRRYDGERRTWWQPRYRQL